MNSDFFWNSCIKERYHTVLGSGPNPSLSLKGQSEVSPFQRFQENARIQTDMPLPCLNPYGCGRGVHFSGILRWNKNMKMHRHDIPFDLADLVIWEPRIRNFNHPGWCFQVFLFLSLNWAQAPYKTKIYDYSNRRSKFCQEMDTFMPCCNPLMQLCFMRTSNRRIGNHFFYFFSSFAKAHSGPQDIYYRGILDQHAHGLSFEGIFLGAARELAVKALFWFLWIPSYPISVYFRA